MTKSTKKILIREVFIIGFSFLLTIPLYFLVSWAITTNVQNKRKAQERLIQELNEQAESDIEETPEIRHQNEVNQILDEISSLNFEFIQQERFQIFYQLKNQDSLIGKYPAPDDNFCLDTIELKVFHQFCVEKEIYTKDARAMKNELFVDCYDQNYKSLIEKLIEKNKLGAEKGYNFQLKENRSQNASNHIYTHYMVTVPPYNFYWLLWILFVIIRITYVSGKWLIVNRNK